MSKHKSKFAKNRARTRRNKGLGSPVGTKGKIPYWATHAVKATENAALFLEAHGLGPYSKPLAWEEYTPTAPIELIEEAARYSREHGIPVESSEAWDRTPPVELIQAVANIGIDLSLHLVLPEKKPNYEQG